MIKDNNSDKINFSVVYNPTSEEVEEFNKFSDYMKADLFKNYKKYEKDGKITQKGLDKKFRGVVSRDKEDNPVMWFTVYAKQLDDETFDFGNNFYRQDGTSYTNEEVMTLFTEPESHDVRMNIYFKHIWFGKYYSCKFNMGSVELNIKTVEYDYGGTPVADVEQTITSSTSGNDDLDSDNEDTGNDINIENSDTEASDASDTEEDSD
jgi:hypothetical protein